MIYLLLAVLLSSYLTLAFKVLEKRSIPIMPSIVFNYFFCVVTGSVLSSTIPFNNTIINSDWFKWAIITGMCFISLFYLIGIVTQKMGVSVASVANKLSMIIAVLFFIIFFNEPYNFIKIVGVFVAITSVIFTSYKSNGDNKGNSLLYMLTFILFLGSGFLDTLFKWVSDRFLQQNNDLLNHYLITSFGIAAIIGFILLFIQYIVFQKTFTFKAVLAGAIIGIPNYFSIYFLGKVYNAQIMESSAIIPVNNLLIVLVSTLAAFFFFKEKLSKLNWIGVLLAIVSIFLIGFSKSI